MILSPDVARVIPAWEGMSGPALLASGVSESRHWGCGRPYDLDACGRLCRPESLLSYTAGNLQGSYEWISVKDEDPRKRLPEGSRSGSCGYAHSRASASGRLRLLALAGKAVDNAVLARHSANVVEVVAKRGAELPEPNYHDQRQQSRTGPPCGNPALGKASVRRGRYGVASVTNVPPFARMVRVPPGGLHGRPSLGAYGVMTAE
jgi:hypothetical protein